MISELECEWGEDMYMGVCPGIQSEDQNQFFTFKARTLWQIEVKISVLALWLGALSSLFHNMGVGVWMLSSLCTCQACSEVCEKMSSLWMCYGTDLSSLWMPGRTHYTRVYIVSSLWMPGQVGVVVCVYGVWYMTSQEWIASKREEKSSWHVFFLFLVLFCFVLFCFGFF